MKLLKTNPIISLIARLIVGTVFIFFAADKIGDPSSFANNISNYTIAPESLVNIMAICLPWIEIMIGFMLILGIRIQTSSSIAMILLITFTTAVFIAFQILGLDISCGCSSDSPKVGWGKVLENSGFIILSWISYFNESRRFAFDKSI